MGSPVLDARLETYLHEATIVLSGELATVPLLEDRLAVAEERGFPTIVVDLHEVAFLDISALHAFLAARQRADQSGHRLEPCGSEPLQPANVRLTGAGSFWTTRTP